MVGHRRQALLLLSPDSGAVYSSISKNEKLEVHYKTQMDSQSDTKGQLRALLAAARKDDIKRAVTSAGPHRDDLFLALDGRDSRDFASQGQQRTLALALKIAGASIMEKETGEKPVLMLDDVFSELDTTRQRALLSMIRGQVLITSADKKTAFKEAKIFTVKNGCVQP